MANYAVTCSDVALSEYTPKQITAISNDCSAFFGKKPTTNETSISHKDNRLGLRLDPILEELFPPWCGEQSNSDVLDRMELSDSETTYSVRTASPKLYVCCICHIPGHKITECPLQRPQSEWLTPYQGLKRCMGEFSCRRCHRDWVSKHSWANMPQQCLKCKISVFPDKQRPLLSKKNLNDVS